MILGLHHAQITVPPTMEKAAIAFYRDVLGLAEVEKPADLRGDRGGGTWFDLGNGQQLHLMAEDAVARRQTKAHVAYAVSDLDHWRQRMTEHEVTPVDCVPIPGHDRFEARDPFGNRIEFIQRVA
jgi:catechol 2,3-dioxygenase-like lactoylglutathione lyase family enzyme